MSSWGQTKLESLVSFSNGRSSPSRENGGTVPVYGSNGIIGFANESNSPAKTIIIGRVGSYCGSLHFSTQNCWVTDNAIRASAKGENDPVFLYFLLTTLKLNDKRAGSGQPLLNQSILNSVPVRVPAPKEQKAIAKILSSLDDKIELNRRMNATLEAMARALFKAWFVDFEPVHANKENRPSTSASPEIAKLFPSDFENGIPQAWHQSTIGEEVQVVGGSTPSTKEPAFWNGEYPWVTPKDFSNLQDKVLTRSERTITQEGLHTISSGQLPVGTVLLSSRAPVGYLAIAKIPVSINQGFIAMKCNKTLSPSYVLQWAEQSMEKIKNRASGTTFAEISKANFRPLDVLVPTDKILKEYERTAGAFYSKITSNVIENESLANIRDELLPRLISGKLRVGV